MLTVHGRVTETCGTVQPLVAYRVQVFLRLALATLDLSIRLGTVTVAADGGYSVSFGSPSQCG